MMIIIAVTVVLKAHCVIGTVQDIELYSGNGFIKQAL